jgi:hypothetical protein
MSCFNDNKDSLQSENNNEKTDQIVDVVTVSISDNIDDLEILYEVSEVDRTILTEQFLCNDRKINKIYANKRLNSTQLATIYTTIANGIIDVSKHIDSASNKTEANDKSLPIESTVKLSASALKIIEENKRATTEKQINDKIAKMKLDANDIISSDLPTVSTLETKIHYYTTAMPNKIIKAIILRSLLTRYMNSSAESLIPLIFEFKNELLAFRNEWIIESETTTDQSSVTDVSVKVNHRKARMQKKVVSASVELFEFPTVVELDTTVISERIKHAINRYVRDAVDVITNSRIDPIRYQMVDSYWRLKPLSTWDKAIKKLNEWQLQGIEYINNNESVVICAPTSAGKTVLAQYCATKFFHKFYNKPLSTDKKQKGKQKIVSTNNKINDDDINKQVLFVVPNSVLAMQVAASFNNAGIKTSMIVNEEEYNTDADNVKVIVATPYRAEEFMCGSQANLSYAIFDEIQQINGSEGEAIERLIKTVNCPFLILSATINEPQNFCNYLSSITDRDVKLLQYNKRFIVQQKHIWTGEQLLTLHPLNCIDTEYILNERFESGDLAMTARDVYVMGCDMANFFSEYNESWKLHPNLYFDASLPITMDMVETYEKYLKDKIIELALVNSERVTEYLQSYNIENGSVWTEDDNDTIYRIIDMFKALKSKNLLPALCFMMDRLKVIDLYTKLIDALSNVENRYFPWYSNFMGQLHDSIEEFNNGEEALKESISKGIVGRGNKNNEIQDRLNQCRREFIKSIMQKICDKYTNEKEHCNESTSLSEGEKSMIYNFLNLDYAQREIEYVTNQHSSRCVKLPEFNQYSPTRLFSFRKTELSATTMRTIRRTANNFIKQYGDKNGISKISYENIYLRGIERGIVLYTQSMSASFQRVVQELIINNQAPICISDDSLAFGVNFPTRTVVILGSTDNENVDVSKGIQMSGRSGRRGFDTQGHVVYARINYRGIMRGGYMPFVGKDTITPFTLLPGKIFGSKDYVTNVVKHPIKEYMSGMSWNHKEILNDFKELYRDDDMYKQDGIMSYLIWLYRDEPDIAYNIFILVMELLNFQKHVKIEEIPIEKSTNESDYDDDVTFSADKKRCYRTVYKMPTTQINQVIELLIRVFDYNQSNENEEVIDTDNEENSTKESKDTKSPFEKMLTSDIWRIPLNMNNTDIIKSVTQKSIVSCCSIENTNEIINRLHHVILCSLKLHNLFAQIGNSNLVSVLNPAINEIINFNNKLKSAI